MDGAGGGAGGGREDRPRVFQGEVMDKQVRLAEVLLVSSIILEAFLLLSSCPLSPAGVSGGLRRVPVRPLRRGAARR